MKPWLASIITLMFLASLLLATAQQPSWQIPLTVMEIEGELHASIDSSGNAVVKGEYKMSAASYKMFKETYSPLSTFIRQFNWGSNPAYIVNATVKADDANNKVVIEYKQYGAAVYMGDGKWRLRLIGPGEYADLKLLSSEDNKVVVTATYMATAEAKFTETLYLTLPKNAKNIEFKEDEGALYYELPLPEKTANKSSMFSGAILAVMGAALIVVRAKKREEPEYPAPPPPPP
jgi:hypothetical protein